MDCTGTLTVEEWAACVQQAIEPVYAAVLAVVAVGVGCAVIIFAAAWARKAIRGI